MQSDLYMQLVEPNKVQLIKLQQHKLFVTCFWMYSDLDGNAENV